MIGSTDKAEKGTRAVEGLTYSWKFGAEWKTIWKVLYKWMESSVTYFSEPLRGCFVLAPRVWCDCASWEANSINRISISTQRLAGLHSTWFIVFCFLSYFRTVLISLTPCFGYFKIMSFLYKKILFKWAITKPVNKWSATSNQLYQVIGRFIH